MTKIPFAAQIPSLLDLRASVRIHMPNAADEVITSVAVLAQAAHEDYQEWITSNATHGSKPINPAEAGNAAHLAAIYLTGEVGL